MIRRLEEDDRAAVVTLLGAAPQLNLYILGNVHTYGFQKDFCEFYGDFADEPAEGSASHLRGLINRYMVGWTVFGERATDWAGLGAVIDAHAVKAERLQDNPGGIESFSPYLQRYEVTWTSEEEIMELPPGALRAKAAPAGFVVRKATMDDLPQLIDLYADADDMARTPAAVERPLRDRKVWLALKDGVAVAAALTNAENEQMGMVGGVYTRPAWRGLGLSQAVCSGLCAELVAAGQQPVLYWRNPSAGHVYAKLGFVPIGVWRSVRLAPRES